MDHGGGDVTVTLGWYAAGLILQLSIFIGGYVYAWAAMRVRLDDLEEKVGRQDEIIEDQAGKYERRQDRFEERVIKLIEEVQRLIGRMEALRFQSRRDDP